MHCVDLGESFPTRIYLHKSASIQPRTSSSKFFLSNIIQYYSFVSLVSMAAFRIALKKGPERAESVFFLLFDARSIRWNYGDGEIGVGPMGHGQGWCHGDCEWHGEFCVRSYSEFVLPTSMNSVLAIHDYSYIGFIPRIFLENDVTFT